jgi:hypothetical protein
LGINRDINIGGLNPNTDFTAMKSFAYKNKVGAVAPVMPLDLDAQLSARFGGGTLPMALRQGMVYYVYRLNDRQAPGVLPYADVKTEAMNMVKKQKALDSLQAKAKEIASLAKAASLTKAGEEEKLEVKHYINQPVATIPYIPSPEIAQMLLNLKPGAVTDPVSVGSGWMIANLISITDLNTVGYETARADMMDSFQDSEMKMITSAWITEQLAQGEETGKIKIYRERCKDYLAGKYNIKQSTQGFGGYY